MRKISIIGLLAILLALTGCDLFNEINLEWSIDNYEPSPTSGRTRVYYTVHNRGRYSLTGINLEIGVATNGFNNYSSHTAWTFDFSLSTGEIKSSTIDVDTSTDVATGAMVLSVDMDKPKD